jgi:hypothetical protein
MCDCENTLEREYKTKLEMIQCILDGQSVAYRVNITGMCLEIEKKEESNRFYCVECNFREPEKEKKHAGKGHRKVKQS